MPAIGLEYRYPARREHRQLRHANPRADRPDRSRGRTRRYIGRLPNEDAQSLVFDDTSLFEWNKFTGYDRAEGGVRANIGAQYTLTGANGFYANAVVRPVVPARRAQLVRAGRSRQCRPRLRSRFERSDYVGRLQVAPNRSFSFVTRGRWDQDDLGLQPDRGRRRARTSTRCCRLTTAVTYARYGAQPEIGYDRRREGIIGSASLEPDAELVRERRRPPRSRSLPAGKNQFVANYRIDPNTAVYDRRPHATLSALSLGFGYLDECTTFTVNYVMAPRDVAVTSGEKDRSHTLLVRLELRTLGEVDLQPERRRRRHEPRGRDAVVPRAGALPLVLTQGDPAGIGPELALSAWRMRRERAVPPFAILADPDRLGALARALGWDVPIRAADIAATPDIFAEAMPVLPLVARAAPVPGRADPANAPAIIEAIERAVALVARGEAAALVTNPDRQARAVRGRLPPSRPHRVSRRPRRAAGRSPRRIRS